MKRKINILLIAAIIFGLAAAWGTYKYLMFMETTYKTSGNFVSVAVAKTNIPARQVITQQMVEFKDIPANYVNSAAIGKPDDVIGKISKNDIYPGEQIIKNNLSGSGDPNEGLAAMVEPGRRALTIAVNDVTGVAGLLKSGDYVDVLGTLDVGKETITSTIVQNIKVLAVNKNISGAGPAENKSQSGTLTLSASPVEAQQLTLASEKGSLRVLLRAPGDEAKAGIPSSNVSHLIR